MPTEEPKDAITTGATVTSTDEAVEDLLASDAPLDLPAGPEIISGLHLAQIGVGWGASLGKRLKQTHRERVGMLIELGCVYENIQFTQYVQKGHLAEDTGYSEKYCREAARMYRVLRDSGDERETIRKDWERMVAIQQVWTDARGHEARLRGNAGGNPEGQTSEAREIRSSLTRWVSGKNASLNVDEFVATVEKYPEAFGVRAEPLVRDMALRSLRVVADLDPIEGRKRLEKHRKELDKIEKSLAKGAPKKKEPKPAPKKEVDGDDGVTEYTRWNQVPADVVFISAKKARGAKETHRRDPQVWQVKEGAAVVATFRNQDLYNEGDLRDATIVGLLAE